ncbi:hypothetical protein DFJ58DRAFT_846130 [Suillus subalutaceus]|uniref:uncharacterized protein n=1 Tax=Suillus subalutaceus TaxID=48586 RepID=UPI001B8615F2|nr:uncharacterized protein DFJ58DRAFT_846130 [Suillus subalutaceus]KAG1838296.1 hypothetical protein DFJ58DRAFT_846130 [Suillus subalutaceus]
MHFKFSFLVVVTALVACMSVTACSHRGYMCKIDGDCCSGFHCNLKSTVYRWAGSLSMSTSGQDMRSDFNVEICAASFRTIVIRHYDYVENIRGVPLPSSKSLEFDGCTSKESTLQTSHKRRLSLLHCMNNIFIFLGVPLNRCTTLCSWWPRRVTMLKLVAKGDFVMKFPDSMVFEGVGPTMVPHIHGGPVLSRKERE